MLDILLKFFMIKTEIKFDVLMIELLTIGQLYFFNNIFSDSFYIYLIVIIIYKDENEE